MSPLNEKINNPTVVPELQPSSHEAVELWYGNLRPDRDIDEVPLDVHLDAIASSALLSTREDLPEDRLQRVRKALDMTAAGSDKLASRVAAEGPPGFTMLDLITELSERKNNAPPAVVMRLVEFGKQTALALRENPLLSHAERFDANIKLSNLNFAGLRYANDNYPASMKNYSDQYIAAVRHEAHWISRNSPKHRDISGGKLFETFIGCMSKYQAWMLEMDDTTIVRHATAREDMPNERMVGGSGHEFAHDVVVNGNEKTIWLQAKWGPHPVKTAANYDLSKVTMISEAGHDGVLETYDKFSDAFALITKSDEPVAAEACEEIAQRYKLSRLLRKASEPVAVTIGSLTLET